MAGAAGTRSGERGFTLLEMIVVIAVLGLAAALIVNSLPPRSARAQVRAATSLVAGGLRTARGKAIATDRPVAVVLDPVARAFRSGADPVIRLPKDVAMAVTRAAIVFAPDGSSSGGRVELGSGTVRESLDVSWLTGRIVTTENP